MILKLTSRNFVVLALMAICAHSAYPSPADKHAAQSAPAEPACLPPASWALLKPGAAPEAVDVRQVVARLLEQDVVLLGEQHDDEDHHRWQLQTIAALHSQRPRMAIGLETFPRRVQPALDRWVAGELNIRQFIEQSDWEKVWNVPIGQYLPIFQFARLNRIPLVALNVESSLNKAVVANGWASIPEAQREGVGTPVAPPVEYRNYLFDVFKQHRPAQANGKRALKPTDPGFVRFVESQTLWDRAMAEGLTQSLARLPAEEKPMVIGIMGSGHVRYGHGVVHQLAALGVTRVGSLLPVPAETACKELAGNLASGVFVVPDLPQVPRDPPRLGVSLDRDDLGVRILEVKPGTLAESTGLQKDDRIIVAAGQGMPSITTVISLIRGTPPGAWLPLMVRRGDELMDVVIKFPPKS